MEQLSPHLMHKLVFTVLMHGLNDTQTPVAYKVLTEALGHPNPQIRELAVVAMTDMPVPPLKRVQALAIAMNDPSSRVRRRAARSLGDQGPSSQDALNVLAAGLRDPDLSVRRDCAGAIGRLGAVGYPAAPALVELLNEPETRTRAIVSVAIKRIGTGCLPALLLGVRSPSPEMRGRCAMLLGEIAPDDERVMSVLQEVLTDSDEEVRAKADAALKFVNTPPPVPMPTSRHSLMSREEQLVDMMS